jgi:hypothetical protein
MILQIEPQLEGNQQEEEIYSTHRMSFLLRRPRHLRKNKRNRTKVPIPTKRPIESLAASQAPIYLKPELRLGGGNSASDGPGHLTCDIESRQRGWKFVWPGKPRSLSSVTCQNDIWKVFGLSFDSTEAAYRL